MESGYKNFCVAAKTPQRLTWTRPRGNGTLFEHMISQSGGIMNAGLKGKSPCLDTSVL